MRANGEKRSETVRPKDDFDLADMRNLTSLIALRVKPDRRQRQVPVLPHQDRRKRHTATPIERD